MATVTDHMDPASADRRPATRPPPPLAPVQVKVACYGCGLVIVYPPARVCTECLLVGHVTEAERAALEGT